MTEVYYYNYTIVTASTDMDYGTRIRSMNLSSNFMQQTPTNLIPDQKLVSNARSLSD